MCPAAVSAATLWLLALLGTGLTPAQASEFPHCSHSFYKQSPPQGSYDGLLRPLCHTRPGGQTFATLYQPTCGSAVYSAFHLSNGLAASTAEEGGEPENKELESVKVVVPALLKEDNEELELSPAASHLRQWDSAVTALVQTKVLPQCQTSGGDLYVLIGAGRLGALGDEAEQCQTKLLWSAVCCAAADGKDSSSVAFIRDTEEEERQVSVKELEDVLGVTELFSEGCGRQFGEDIAEAVQSQAQTVSAVSSVTPPEAENIETKELNTDNSETESNSEQTESSTKSSVASEEKPVELNTDNSETESNSEQTEGSTESRAVSEEKPVVAESAETDQVSPDSEESAVTSSNPSESRTAAESSMSSETVEEQEEDNNSTSTLFYILSTTMYILKAPLRPIMSTITELPGQVLYVLQEDLGVLCTLPGDTYSVFHLLISDMFSWVGSVFNLVYDIGEACFSRVYYCTSSMGEALVGSCYTGVTGIGTLACDTLGIFGDMFDNSWWVTRFFGGRLVEQSGDYVETVVGELGGQASAVGKGFGNLAWKSGTVVGKVLKIGWRVVMGVVDIIANCIGDAYEQSSDRSEETFDLSAVVLPEKTEAE